MLFDSIKNRAVELLGLPSIARLIAGFSDGEVVIIMFHRFSAASRGRSGSDPALLRETLAALRSAGVELVSAEQAVEDWDADSLGIARKSPKRPPRVAFTVDDGYADALDVAAPIFSEFDCPATCFVVPEVVDGREWFWWDKVDTVLRGTNHRALNFNYQSVQRTFDVSNVVARRNSYESLCEWIKRLPTDSVTGFLEQLSLVAEVPLPSSAPGEYRMLSWEDMVSAEQKGWRFGAHTMTHPVVGRCTDERAEWEIGASLAAVKTRLTKPSPLFCYPVGRDGDFGQREFEILERHGVRWALSAVPGRLSQHGHRGDHRYSRLCLPRFAADERPGGVMRMFVG